MSAERDEKDGHMRDESRRKARRQKRIKGNEKKSKRRKENLIESENTV